MTGMDVGLALVGHGAWGRNLARNFADLGALRWVCDTDPAALAGASAYPDARTTGHFEDVLADPGVRAVALATPSGLHARMATEAIKHDKDVFVEKPLALRYKEGRDLVDAAEASGAVLMVGHILEYHPAVTRLKELVRAGELGELRYVYSNRLNLGTIRTEENILWSFAPHDISVITSLANEEPDRVSTWGGSYLQAGIADVTLTNLSFPRGLLAHVFVSWLHPFKEQRLVVVGERGMAVFDDTADEGKLRIYDRGVEWENGVPVARQAPAKVPDLPGDEPMRLELEHFIGCVTNRSQPLTNGANGLLVLRVLEASQASLERGASVDLAEVVA